MEFNLNKIAKTIYEISTETCLGCLYFFESFNDHSCFYNWTYQVLTYFDKAIQRLNLQFQSDQEKIQILQLVIENGPSYA